MHLTKNLLESWMTDIEERNTNLENILQFLLRELAEVKSVCVPTENPILNSIVVATETIENKLL